MRISLTIPDSLYQELKAKYQEAGFNTLNDFILEHLRPRHQSGAVHQIDVTEMSYEAPVNPPEELNVKCEMSYCKSKANGLYEVATPDLEEGTRKKKWYLCRYHLSGAKREGGVTEIER